MNQSTEFDERRVAAAQIFRAIALELLEATALDLNRPIPDPSDRSERARTARQDRADAVRWVGGRAAHMSFAMCCDALDVDAETVRRQLTSDPATLYARLRDGRQAREVQSADADLSHEADDFRDIESIRPPAVMRHA